MSFHKITKLLILITLIFFITCKNSTILFHSQIHIDFWFKSEFYYNFVRIVYFPEQKTTLFLFFYPEANINKDSQDLQSKDENLKSQSLLDKISVFSSITNKNPDITISLDKSSLIRLVNFTEGMNVFLPIQLNFTKSDFNFTVGSHKLFGEDIYEFLTLLESEQENNKEFIELFRHYRWQTFILNFFYQLKSKPKLLQKENQMVHIHSLLKTNANINQLNTIFMSILGSKFFLLEFPVLAFSHSQGNPVYALNFTKAKEMYSSFVYELGELETKKIPVNLEIINANGTDRLANRVKMRIHSEQFKVLNTDNFSTTIPNTILLCNYPKGRDLNKIQNLLFLKEDQIFFYRTLKDVPYTLILGEDFSIKNLLKK